MDGTAATPAIVGDLPLNVSVATVVPLEIFTLRYALGVLAACKGNKAKAARALAVSRFALARLVKRARTLGLVA